MAKYTIYGIWLSALLLMCRVTEGMGQRISFQAFAGADIDLSSPQGPNPALNFNSKRRVLTPNIPELIRIGRGEGEPYVVYAIQAAEGFDIMIDIDFDSQLWLDGDPASENSIPMSLAVSYNNQGAVNAMQARNNAVEAPAGTKSLIVPVSPRAAGAPGPPPDPLSGSLSSRPRGTVYLFLYGDLGPIGSVRAGTYTADITINVSYAAYGDH
jgi:hypothetical protein